MKLWCRIAGHAWRHIGSIERGQRVLVWQCSRCRVARKSRMWMMPPRGGWFG